MGITDRDGLNLIGALLMISRRDMNWVNRGEEDISSQERRAPDLLAEGLASY